MHRFLRDTIRVAITAAALWSAGVPVSSWRLLLAAVLLVWAMNVPEEP
jgi:hypothetical protein